MIGDWAYIYHPTQERTPVKVDGVWIEAIEHIDNGLTREDSPMFRIVDPIPLTPEILEKNGFRWTGSGDSTGMLSTPWGFDGIRYNIYVGLKKKTIEVHSAHPELRTESWRKVNKISLEVCGCFVHELQHALKLCGINLEIKV